MFRLSKERAIILLESEILNGLNFGGNHNLKLLDTGEEQVCWSFCGVSSAE